MEHNRKPTDNDLVRAIGRLEGKIDGMLLAEAERTRREVLMDTRIRSVETRLSSLVGWAAGAGAAASAFVTFLLKLAL